MLGYTDETVNNFFAKALYSIGEDWGMEKLLPPVMEVGEVNLKAMELLDKANTETYGVPQPVEVSMEVEKGPFIVITGHDLRDLQFLPEQTKDKGINIYTHEKCGLHMPIPSLRLILILRVISVPHGKISKGSLQIYPHLSFIQQTALCLPKQAVRTEYILLRR